MLITAVISSIALLLASAAARPSASAATVLSTNPNIEISNLVVNDTSTGNTQLSFEVQNPEPLAAQAVAKCRGEWSHSAKDWPVSSSSLRCDQSQTITWFIDSWTSARDFVVGVQDRFDDPSVGKDPYGHVTTFSKFIVNATSVQYNSPDLNADPVYGSQIAELIIYAPIYAVSAK